MDMKCVQCLTNRISQFTHLVSCQKMKPMPIHKVYGNMVGALKILKTVLDCIVDCKIPSDEILYQNCKELEIVVNEAREFMEKWSSKMSKICSVWRSEALFVKIHSSSLEICHVLCRLLQSSSSASILVGIQHRMQEIQCLKHERIMEYIEDAVRSQRNDMVPCRDHLTKIIELVDLTSNQELLKESMAVEKERMNAEVNKAKGEFDYINQIVNLIPHIRECMPQIEQVDATTCVPVPSYFRCPLSLELMSDPVIVASGQTYDRISIQKWLDNGLTICPKTGQTLTHTSLIGNYTVKAMIENWCEGNRRKLSNGSEHTNMVAARSPLPFNHVSSQDFVGTESFHSLHSSNSTSISSLVVGNGFEKQKIDVSSRLSGEESNGCQDTKTDNLDNPSHELSYLHSQSESVSSAISSIEYASPVSNEASRISYKFENMNIFSGEIISEIPVTSFSKNEHICSPSLLGKKFDSSNAKADVADNGNHNYCATHPFPFSDSGYDDLTTTSHVTKLIEDLKSQSNEVQTKAAAELRFLAKHNMENRGLIGCCGAIVPLLSLLYSQVKLTQEHAVTALLNLSINEENKGTIAEAGAIEPLIHVLRSGNDGAKENSAAALFSLSVIEEFKAKIGRSGAVKALVDLLGSGTLRGKKDAATALFNLLIFHENKARIVQAGVMKYLVELMDPESGMTDKAVALLAGLSTISEGCLAIAREGGIPLLVEIVESGSQRGKENAASVLLLLCLNSPRHCRLVLEEGAVPPLVALSQSGTPRAKEKAQQLLSHFRNQRDRSMGKKR